MNSCVQASGVFFRGDFSELVLFVAEVMLSFFAGYRAIEKFVNLNWN